MQLAHPFPPLLDRHRAARDDEERGANGFFLDDRLGGLVGALLEAPLHCRYIAVTLPTLPLLVGALLEVPLHCRYIAVTLPLLVGALLHRLHHRLELAAVEGRE